MVVSAHGVTVIADQSQFDEEEIRKLQKGQLDVLDSDFFIINDTSYLITNDTEFFDSRDDLEVGSIVWFKTSDDNRTLEEIYLDESSSTVEQSASASDNDIEENSESASSGEMRLENGVWVN